MISTSKDGLDGEGMTFKADVASATTASALCWSLLIGGKWVKKVSSNTEHGGGPRTADRRALETKMAPKGHLIT
jgi:hypothetical protein